MTTHASWGRYPSSRQTGRPVTWPDQIPEALKHLAAATAEQSTLGYGMGRSYGDSCLSDSGQVLLTSGMNRLIHADWITGQITAQAGMTLKELIAITLPQGWFLPVTPGTQFVTLGGAVANDVHGKNHHVMGTFGRHVTRLRLFRSHDGWLDCSPTENGDLFRATVAGLGLTGLLSEVTLQLRPIQSSLIDQRSIRFGDLDEFFALSSELDPQYEYTVSWIDCLAKGGKAGRGHYIAGNHAHIGPLHVDQTHPRTIPLVPPISLVNRATLRPFNTLYYHRQRVQDRQGQVDYRPFFYPLDALLHWNRMYGRKGFQQYQCVVPNGEAPLVMRSLLAEIARSGTGSFLAVLKQCGDLTSPGWLSFPMPGLSLALDFPQRAAINERLFKRLDQLVHEAGGRLYPAKDAHVCGADFRKAYPDWSQVEARRDPLLLSKFWKRVTQ